MRLTHNLSFLLLSLSSHSVPLCLSLYLHPTLACRGSSQPPPPHGLIVLHLFIQAFMATSSSRGLISSSDDGSLPRLSPLFIIGVHSHHISLTLGRWFSHWTTLPARHITNLPRRAQGKARTVKRHRRSGGLKPALFPADLIASKMQHGMFMRYSGPLLLLFTYLVSNFHSRVSDEFRLMEDGSDMRLGAQPRLRESDSAPAR